MKMKLIMEKFNRFKNEARIAPPSTRGEAGFDELVNKILQDDNVPEKAKQLFKKSVDDRDDEHIRSMLVLISNFAPEYEGAEKFLELPEKYDYNSSEDGARQKHGQFSIDRLEYDIISALKSIRMARHRDYRFGKDMKMNVSENSKNPFKDAVVFVRFDEPEDAQKAIEALEANGLQIHGGVQELPIWDFSYQIKVKHV
tara:strand:+ start:156 stop:752 length:597 start_codon:yes stop_codon:yes gene_type:complete